jgi:anti-sigma B factor antagonist
MSDEPKFHVNRQEGVTIVQLTAKQITDEFYIAELGDELNALLDQGDPPDLLVDFGQVEFLSSAALGLLTVLLKHVRQREGRLRLCSIRGPILEAFRITNLDRVFEIYADADEALAA